MVILGDFFAQDQTATIRQSRELEHALIHCDYRVLGASFIVLGTFPQSTQGCAILLSSRGTVPTRSTYVAPRPIFSSKHTDHPNILKQASRYSFRDWYEGSHNPETNISKGKSDMMMFALS